MEVKHEAFVQLWEALGPADQAAIIAEIVRTWNIHIETQNQIGRDFFRSQKGLLIKNDHSPELLALVKEALFNPRFFETFFQKDERENRFSLKQVIALFTFTPAYCPTCGTPVKLEKSRAQAFEGHKVVRCGACGQKWLKLPFETVLKSSREMGSDLEAWTY